MKLLFGAVAWLPIAANLTLASAILYEAIGLGAPGTLGASLLE